MRLGLDFKALIRDKGRWLDSNKVLSMHALTSKIEHRIMNLDKLYGVPSQYFHFFNTHIKGLRKGELTVLTGASGSGKTTFLS